LDLPSKLVLTVGEKAAVRLVGHGSAGYLWTAQVGEPGGVVGVSLETAPAQPRPSGELWGGSVDELLAIQALRSGSVTVHLELARPYNPPRPPLAQHDIEVIVVPAGSQSLAGPLS
jgi:Chagasin family peptidase inhibitor I42